MTTTPTPTLCVEGERYIVEWQGLRAEFSHLRQLEGAQYGGLNGEVRVSAHLPGISPHLHAARVNLSSTSSKKTLTGAVRERIPNDVIGLPKVEDFIEYACVMTINRFREGRPLLNLADLTPQPPHFAIEKLFPSGKRCQVFAPAENMKTTLVLAMLMDVAEGTNQLGFGVEPGFPALLDWETDEDDATNLWHRLAKGRGLSHIPNLFYQRVHRPIWEEAESLAPQFKSLGVSIVALDSVFWLCGGNPNDQEKVGMAFQGIDSLGPMTSLLINHTASSETDKKRRRHYGLEHWRNACRASWEVRKADTPGNEWTSLGLYRDKLNMRRPDGPFGFNVRFEGDDGPIYVERADEAINQSPELEESLPTKDRVVHYLNGMRGKAATPKQIEETLDITHDNLKQTVRRLKGAVTGVTIAGTFMYAITTKQEEPIDWVTAVTDR